MANHFAVPPAAEWRVNYVITGATVIHQLTTPVEQVANNLAAELRAAGFLVTIDRVIDLELTDPKLLSNNDERASSIPP